MQHAQKVLKLEGRKGWGRAARAATAVLRAHAVVKKHEPTDCGNMCLNALLSGSVEHVRRDGSQRSSLANYSKSKLQAK